MDYKVLIAKVNATLTFTGTLPEDLELKLGNSYQWMNGPMVSDCTLLGSVMVYQIAELAHNGYIATHVLDSIYERTGKRMGIFGAPRQVGENNYHLLFPCDLARDNRITILDWGIDEWLLTKTQQN